MVVAVACRGAKPIVVLVGRTSISHGASGAAVAWAAAVLAQAVTVVLAGAVNAKVRLERLEQLVNDVTAGAYEAKSASASMDQLAVGRRIVEGVVVGPTCLASGWQVDRSA